MNTYLTIMITILVATQIIRVSQNAINLIREEERIEKQVGWLKNVNFTEYDFELQRAVWNMMYDKLKKEGFKYP